MMLICICTWNAVLLAVCASKARTHMQRVLMQCITLTTINLVQNALRMCICTVYEYLLSHIRVQFTWMYTRVGQFDYRHRLHDSFLWNVPQHKMFGFRFFEMKRILSLLEVEVFDLWCCHRKSPLLVLCALRSKRWSKRVSSQLLSSSRPTIGIFDWMISDVTFDPLSPIYILCGKYCNCLKKKNNDSSAQKTKKLRRFEWSNLPIFH